MKDIQTKVNKTKKETCISGIQSLIWKQRSQYIGQYSKESIIDNNFFLIFVIIGLN